jgi:hypothetical protein
VERLREVDSQTHQEDSHVNSEETDEAKFGCCIQLVGREAEQFYDHEGASHDDNHEYEKFGLHSKFNKPTDHMTEHYLSSL